MIRTRPTDFINRRVGARFPNYSNLAQGITSRINPPGQGPNFLSGSAYPGLTATAQPAPAAPSYSAQNYTNDWMNNLWSFGGGRSGPPTLQAGTPGTYVSPGGRVLPTSYQPVAAAQTSYDPESGVSFAEHMAKAGFPSGPVPAGTIIGGAPASRWDWETMSSPEMDWAAGWQRLSLDTLKQRYPVDPAQVKAYEAEGLPPSWYDPSAKTYEDVAALFNARSENLNFYPVSPELEATAGTGYVPYLEAHANRTKNIINAPPGFFQRG